MAAVETIERVLAAQAAGADLFVESLTQVPQRGATEEEITKEAQALGRAPSPEYLALLRRWNGLDLDVVRFFGVGPCERGLSRLSEEQERAPGAAPSMLVIGADPSGFTFLESAEGAIFQFDHDGGSLAHLADSFDLFVAEVLFGRRAGEFLGEEWLAQLRAVQLVSD